MLHLDHATMIYVYYKYQLDERKLKFANYIRDEKSRQQNALNKIELASKEIKEKDSEIAELEEERDAVRKRFVSTYYCMYCERSYHQIWELNLPQH